MRLTQAAVFWYAGSYVIRPKSSEDVLIWRRSMARMAPCSIGTSYFLPVRLSVIVRVSAISAGASRFVSVDVVSDTVTRRISCRCSWDPIGAGQPAIEIDQLTSLAAERVPAPVRGPLTA